MSSNEHREEHGLHHPHHHGADRTGARQPNAFNPARAALLDDPQRFEYLPPEQIVALLDAPRGAVVIDFGTGTGTFAIEIAKRRPDLHIVALDEQPGMLELLRAKPEAKNIENLEAILSDAIDRFAGSADRVLALNVLHELSDDALRQMAGLLKPSGTMLIIDWDSAAERPVGPPKDHTYNAAEASTRLQGFGLRAEAAESMKYHFVLRARR
ncbi:MAG: class I SAM-dependent methyltransferase [Candidatus Binataceae bacterium]